MTQETTSRVRTQEKTITLGGGGFDGARLIGVIAKVQEAGDDPDFWLGISIGSVAATLVANEMPIQAMKTAFFELSRPSLLQLAKAAAPEFVNPFTLLKGGWRAVQAVVRNCGLLYSVDYFEEFVRKNNLEWKPNLLIGVYDLLSKKSINLDSNSGMPLHIALAASCAIPAVFCPVAYRDANGTKYIFVDGGVGHMHPAVGDNPIVVKVLDYKGMGLLFKNPSKGQVVSLVHRPDRWLLSPLTWKEIERQFKHGYEAAETQLRLAPA